MHELTVCKFGGSSLADADCFRRVRDIIRADRRRRYIIVSAPGKSAGDSAKMTDMLIRAHTVPNERPQLLAHIRRKYTAIAGELSIAVPQDALDSLDTAAAHSRDAIASRGEHINARLLSEYAGLPFIEAADVFIFKEGSLDVPATYRNLRNIGPCGVIPGFYGSDGAGSIVTFPRGGSDISAAHVAAALGADLYENWTDVDGFFTADPALVNDARLIECMNWEQARLFACLGAEVLHYDSISPAAEAGIPILVRNTFRPDGRGTMICADGNCPMPCITSRALASSKYLISALNLTPAMRIKALEILHGGTEHGGMVCAECEAEELAQLTGRLHRALMALA